MAELTITIQGSRELIDRLDRLKESLSDMSKPFKTAGGYLTKFYSSVPFASNGSIYGTSWPALSDKYAERKAAKWGGGKPTLIADGTLAKSFVFESSKDLLQIYNSTGDLFSWHQLGMGNNPQRVMMLLDQAREKVVTDEVAAEVQRQVENG